MINTNTPLWSAKYIFPSHTNIHTFVLNRLLPSSIPLTFSLKHMTILSSQHMTILS